MAKNVIINGVTYLNVPEVNIPQSDGGTAQFYDISDATAVQSQILAGKSGYVASGKVTGSMINNGDTSNVITTKDGAVTIPSGYTSGGTVAIASAQQSLLTSDNIKNGITVLGVSGSPMVVDTTISSGGATTANILSGYSAYVNGSLVEGAAVVPMISQDSTTKILSIV